MINIRFDVERVDYEKSIEGLMPAVQGWVSGSEKMQELEKLLNKLGKDAVPVLKKLFGYLKTDVKDEILIWLLQSHKDQLKDSANSYLEEAMKGKTMQIGSLSAENKPGAQMVLRATRVQVDYAQLLKSPLIEESAGKLGGGLLGGAVSIAAQLGSKMSPETLEKQGIALLGNEKIKTKILSTFQDGLEKAGLYVTFRDMAVEPDVPKEKLTDSAEKHGLIPDAFEDGLLDGLAAWLKATV